MTGPRRIDEGRLDVAGESRVEIIAASAG
jgi:hypothetical protein